MQALDEMVAEGIGSERVELSAVQDGFKGVNLHVWLRARKALRARSTSRKTWNKETVFKAIDDIEALVEKRSVLFGIADKSLSAERLKKLEKDLFASFEIDAARTLQDDGAQVGREIIPREPDPDTPADARKAQRKTKAGKAWRPVKPPKGD